jgi:hypothetical protein
MDSNGGKENGGESAPRRTDPVRISINPDDLLGERGIWLLRTELLMVIEDELEIVATEEEKAEWMARQQAVEQHYARDRESVVSDYTDLVRETCQQRGITAPLEITTTDGIGQQTPDRGRSRDDFTLEEELNDYARRCLRSRFDSHLDRYSRQQP